MDVVFQSFDGFWGVARSRTGVTGGGEGTADGAVLGLGLNANLGLCRDEVRSASRVFSKPLNCCIIRTLVMIYNYYKRRVNLQTRTVVEHS